MPTSVSEGVSSYRDFMFFFSKLPKDIFYDKKVNRIRMP